MKPEKITEGNAIEPWRQHLLDAAAYMEEHGHFKGRCTENAFNGTGRVCVLGALLATNSKANGIFGSEEVEALERHLGIYPSRWNDRPETTKEMAVDALIGAALS